jgi:hypothetical protein
MYCVGGGIGGRVSSDESYCPNGGTQAACPMFVASPEVVASICMGAVNDGVKFCTLGTNSRSYSTHEKKVPIKPSHIYIASINKVSLKLSFPSHEYLLQEAANCTYFRDPTT